MNYKTWYQEHYPHLYEIYYHILLPGRFNISPKQVSTLTFSEFCDICYQAHGSRCV